MINPEIINTRLEEIEENLKLLEELKSIPKNKFCSDPRLFKLAERCLEINIQALLDIAHHIIAGNSWPRPKDNNETISIIANHEVIPKDFAEKILPMAGLRNILVHEYIKIDPAIIYEHIQNLEDFRQFQEHIITYLQNLPESR